jgi:hypothetical protein
MTPISAVQSQTRSATEDDQPFSVDRPSLSLSFLETSLSGEMLAIKFKAPSFDNLHSCTNSNSINGNLIELLLILKVKI